MDRILIWWKVFYTRAIVCIGCIVWPNLNNTRHLAIFPWILVTPGTTLHHKILEKNDMSRIYGQNKTPDQGGFKFGERPFKPSSPVAIIVPIFRDASRSTAGVGVFLMITRTFPSFAPMSQRVMISLILSNPFLWSATCAGVITRFLFTAESS